MTPPRPPAPVQGPIALPELLRRLQKLNATANALLYIANRRTLG